MNANFETFPNTRLRRLRAKPWIRDILTEYRLTIDDVIWPIFIHDKDVDKLAIPSLPGVFSYNLATMVEQIKWAEDNGIKAVALFPNISDTLKSKACEEAYSPSSLINKAIALIKQHVPSIGVICDIALDPYNIDGHDGICDDNGNVLNDETLEVLVKQALSHANAGADCVAPSDMMDGRIAAIRQALENNNHQNTLILSYSAKYASHFYGPFRDAVGSSSALKCDKKTYQMSYSNGFGCAAQEISLDITEGADIIMIKPAMSYLDIIVQSKQNFNKPIFAYHVSGEYAMIHAAAQNGWLNLQDAALEQLTALKRAGCSGIFTYFAPQLVDWLKQ